MRNEINQVGKNVETEVRAREPYSTPKLREFGPVGTLTQAGTAGLAEAGGGSAQMKA